VLQRYEDKSAQLYKDIIPSADSGGLPGVSLANDNEFLANLQQSIMKLQNPYTNVYYWVKGEINDCLAL